MKKFVLAAAATGLLSLAACNSEQAERNEAAGEAYADNLQAQADNLEDAAEAAPTENAEAALENASENMEKLSPSAVEKILSGNARRLYKL